MDSIPELYILFQRFGIALALGLILGIEREKEKSTAFAGIRTFPLICLFGCAAAMINDVFSPYIFAVSFLMLSALVITAHIFQSSEKSGTTTEIATFLCFLFGGFVWWGMTALAAALAVVTVLFLATKKPLEGMSKKLGQKDIVAGIQFGIITLIVLPILPNQTYGPLDVINPYVIWLMVVLIAGINFIGYGLIKTLGAQQGIGLSGVLGGLASSTALTLSFTRRSKIDSGFAPEFALAIVVASSIMFIRVLVEAFVVNPSVGRVLVVPVGCTFLAGVTGCFFVWISRRKKTQPSEIKENIKTSNPFELWPAILFGILFGVILFIAKAAETFWGDAGIYISSIAAGMADVDPITLSLSTLARDNTITDAIAVRGIMLAALANTAVKMFLTLTGAPSLFRYTLPLFGAMIATGLIVSFLVI